MMHGPETTVELRKAGFKGAVIGVTENVLQEDVDHFIQCGANAVLAKPQVRYHIPYLNAHIYSLS